MDACPENDMQITVDCVGILKERNVDVEQKLTQYKNRSEKDELVTVPTKKRSTRCRLVFRTQIPETNEILQVVSSPILWYFSFYHFYLVFNTYNIFYFSVLNRWERQRLVRNPCPSVASMEGLSSLLSAKTFSKILKLFGRAPTGLKLSNPTKSFSIP